MATIKEEITSKIENFETLYIEQTKDGRKISVDGKEIDLSKISSLEININPLGITLQTRSSVFREL